LQKEPKEWCFDVLARVAENKGYKISDPAISSAPESEGALAKSMD
jgi:hypothetical protein